MLLIHKKDIMQGLRALCLAGAPLFLECQCKLESLSAKRREEGRARSRSSISLFKLAPIFVSKAIAKCHLHALICHCQFHEFFLNAYPSLGNQKQEADQKWNNGALLQLTNWGHIVDYFLFWCSSSLRGFCSSRIIGARPPCKKRTSKGENPEGEITRLT